MGSKEDFLKKQSENEESRAENEKQLVANIEDFKSSMNVLASKISEWIVGTPLELVVNQININDDTVPRGYKITQITVKNGSKSVHFEPDVLYYFGQQGGVNLRFEGSRPTRKFTLFRKTSFVKDLNWDNFVLETFENGNRKHAPFEEDEFFSILNLIA